MNIIEKQVIKILWRKYIVKNLRRYIPLLAVLYISAITILQAWGMGDAAKQLSTLGGVVGLDQASPVSGPELAAAGTAVSGVLLKLFFVVRNAFPKE